MVLATQVRPDTAFDCCIFYTHKTLSFMYLSKTQIIPTEYRESLLLTLFLGLEQIIQQNIEIQTTEKLELNIYNQTLCLGED